MSGSLLDPRSFAGRSRLRRTAAVLAAAMLLLAPAACGDDDGAAAPEGPVADLPEVADDEYQDLTGRSEVTIDTRDNSFVPQYAVVSPGTEVTFENRGRNPHNVIAAEAGAFVDIPVDELQPGDSSPIVFGEPGEYPYYCSLHATPSRGMIGRIRVAEE